MKVAVLTTNGTVEVREMGPKLLDIYAAIGNGCDMFEQLRIGHNGAGLIDEEAKIRSNPPRDNALATEFCAHMNVGLARGDRILGNMVLVGCGDGDYCDVPQDLLDAAIAFAGANAFARKPRLVARPE